MDKNKNINDMTVPEVKEAVTWLREEANEHRIKHPDVSFILIKAYVDPREDETYFRVISVQSQLTAETPAEALEQIQSITAEKENQIKIAELKAQIAKLEGGAK